MSVQAESEFERNLEKIQLPSINWPANLAAYPQIQGKKKLLERKLKEILLAEKTAQSDFAQDPNKINEILASYKKREEPCYAELRFFAEQCKHLNPEEESVSPEEVIAEFEWAYKHNIYEFTKEAFTEMQKIPDSPALTQQQQEDFIYEFALLTAQEKQHKEYKKSHNIDSTLDDPTEKEILLHKKEWSSKIQSIVHLKYLTETAPTADNAITGLITKEYDLCLMSELPTNDDNTPNPKRGKVYLQKGNPNGWVDYIVLGKDERAIIKGSLHLSSLQKLVNAELSQNDLDKNKNEILSTILRAQAEQISKAFLAHDLSLENFLRQKVCDAVANQEKCKKIIGYQQKESVEDVNCQAKIAQLLEKFETFNNASFAEKQKFVEDLWGKIERITLLEKERQDHPTMREDVKLLLQNQEKELRIEIDNIIKDIVTTVPEEVQKLFKISSKPNFTPELIDELLKKIKPTPSKSSLAKFFKLMGDKIASTRIFAFIESTFKAIFSFIHTDVAKALSPFRWMVDNSIKLILLELKDILIKPKAYVDRLFRASVILSSTAAIVFGGILAIGLIGNPFTGLPVLATIGTICASIALVAASTKLAKWISSKVSIAIYKVDNPDRYIPTKEAIQCLGWNELAPKELQTKIKKLKKYIISEVSAVNKEINAVPDPNGTGKKAVELLQKKLELIEKIWDQVQTGDATYLTQFFQLLQQEQYTIRRKAIDNEHNLHGYKLSLMSSLPKVEAKLLEKGKIYLNQPNNGKIEYVVLGPDEKSVCKGFIDISSSPEKWQKGLTQGFLDKYSDSLLQDVLKVTLKQKHTLPGINDTIKEITNLLVQDVVDLKLKKKEHQDQQQARTEQFKKNCELLFTMKEELLDKHVISTGKKIKNLNKARRLMPPLAGG